MIDVLRAGKSWGIGRAVIGQPSRAKPRGTAGPESEYLPRQAPRRAEPCGGERRQPRRATTSRAEPPRASPQPQTLRADRSRAGPLAGTPRQTEVKQATYEAGPSPAPPNQAAPTGEPSRLTICGHGNCIFLFHFIFALPITCSPATRVLPTEIVVKRRIVLEFELGTWVPGDLGPPGFSSSKGGAPATRCNNTGWMLVHQNPTLYQVAHFGILVHRKKCISLCTRIPLCTRWYIGCTKNDFDASVTYGGHA